MLKGGLVYSEESHQGPVYLNQNYYTFARKTNTTTLATAARLCRDLTSLYKLRCADIAISAQRFNIKLNKTLEESEETDTEIVISDKESHVSDALQVCTSMNARLPEIRDMTSREQIRQAAIAANITKIRAGIYWDQLSSNFRFESDHVTIQSLDPNPWKVMYYGAHHTWQEHGENIGHFKRLNDGSMSSKWPIIYSNPQDQFRIKLADTPEIGSWQKILCERPKAANAYRSLQYDEASSPLIHLADHSCKRDTKGLSQTTDILIRQIAQITNLNISVPNSDDTSANYLPEMVEMDGHRTDQRLGRSAEDTNQNYQQDEVIISNILYASSSSNMSFWMTPYQQSLIHELRHIFSIEKSGMNFHDWLKIQLHDRSYLIQGIISKLEYTELDLYHDNVLTMMNDTLDEEDAEALTNVFHFIVDSRIFNLFVSYIKSQSRKNEDHDHDHIYEDEEDEIDYDNETDEEFFNKENGTEHSRHTRAIPLWVAPVAGITTGANIVTSLATGDAPLSWFGDIFSSLFGLQTKAQQHEQNKLALKTAEAVEKLSINQKQLNVAINAANARIDTYTKYVMSSHRAVSIIAMEQDLKAMVRHLQLLIDTTLQKVANILVASMTDVISPYALSHEELKRVASDAHTNNKITVSTAYTDTKMKAVVVNNELTLIFQSPIVDESQLYHFYRVKALPVFIQNRTFTPVIDANYIAISHDGSDYISMSSDEFSRCTTTPTQCYVTNPAVPITSNADCSMVTYRDLVMKCPLVETDIVPSPTVHIKDNKVIYSVPSETGLLARCENTKTHKPDQAHFKVQGMGEISFRPACTVTLPDGSHFKTPSGYAAADIPELALYEILNIHPVPTNVTLRMMTTSIEHTPIMTLSFDNMTIPSLEDLRLEAYHPKNAIPFLIRFFSIIMVIIIIIAMILSYRKCIQKYRCYKRGESYSPKDQENKHDDITKELKEMEVDYAGHAPVIPPKWNRWTSGSSVNVNSMSNSMMDLKNRIFRTASTPQVNQDSAEKGQLSTFNTYMSNKEEDQVSFPKDRVKLVYKPLTPILKRRLEEKEFNPELLRPLQPPAVRFSNQNLGPSVTIRPNTVEPTDPGNPAKRLKESTADSETKL